MMDNPNIHLCKCVCIHMYVAQWAHNNNESDKNIDDNNIGGGGSDRQQKHASKQKTECFCCCSHALSDRVRLTNCTYPTPMFCLLFLLRSADGRTDGWTNVCFLSLFWTIKCFSFFRLNMRIEWNENLNYCEREGERENEYLTVLIPLSFFEKGTSDRWCTYTLGKEFPGAMGCMNMENIFWLRVLLLLGSNWIVWGFKVIARIMGIIEMMMMMMIILIMA